MFYDCHAAGIRCAVLEVSDVRATANAGKTYFDLGIISVSHGFSDGFSGLLAPVLALIVIEFGLSELQTGLLLSLPGLATFLLILPVSLIADLRRNRLELFVAGLALASAAYFSMAHVGTFGVLLALAFLARCGNAVFHPCGTALVAERFPDRRAMAISVFGIAGTVGAAGIPLIQGLIADVAGWRVSIAVFAIPVALLLPLIWMRYRRIRGGQPPAGPKPLVTDTISMLRQSLQLFRTVFHNQRVVGLGVTYALTAIAAKSSTGFLPLLAVRRFAMSTTEIGLMVSLYYASGIAFKALAVLFYRRLGTGMALRIPLALSLGAVLGMVVAPSAGFLMVLVVIAGFANSISPIVLTATADSCAPSQLTSSVGLVYWLHSMWFVGPLLGGAIADHFGLLWVYVFAAAVFAGAAGVTVARFNATADAAESAESRKEDGRIDPADRQE